MVVLIPQICIKISKVAIFLPTLQFFKTFFLAILYPWVVSKPDTIKVGSDLTIKEISGSHFYLVKKNLNFGRPYLGNESSDCKILWHFFIPHRYLQDSTPNSISVKKFFEWIGSLVAGVAVNRIARISITNISVGWKKKKFWISNQLWHHCCRLVPGGQS